MARFLISHRLAGKQSESRAQSSRHSFEAMRHAVSAFTDVIGERSPKEGNRRGLMLAEGDAREFEAKRREYPSDLIIEPETLRQAAVFAPTSVGLTHESGQAGIGAAVELTARCRGIPVAGARITLMLKPGRGGPGSAVYAETDNSGFASLPFDPRNWIPTVVLVVPRAGAWACWQPVVSQKILLSLIPLPRNAPLGWWHFAMGIQSRSEGRGQGLRIGVIDTGVGPHPYLTHVRSAGAFIEGGYNGAPGAEADVAQHGTHITGIIGARPPASSRDFEGIATGADVIVARVYSGIGATPENEAGLAGSGDIANAVDELSETYEADIINLSMGGLLPSEIEADALLAAFERGSIVICSAGNGHGAPVMFPAAYPQVVSVSATGLVGCVPPGTLDSLSLPLQADRYALSSLYLASFSSFGPEIKCTGPGVGIISTVPGGSDAPYVEMSGTSMASPAVAAALATILSADTTYQQTPRGPRRTLRAWAALSQKFLNLGLNPEYQGYGLVGAHPQ